MAAQVKVGLSTTEAKKSLMELSNFVKKSFGKSNISLFDEDTKSFLSGQAAKQLGVLENKTGRLKSLASGYAAQLKNAAGDAEKEVRARDKLLRVTKQLAEAEKDRAALAQMTNSSKGVGMGTGMKQGMAKMPGAGMFSAIGEMGMGGALGLGLAGGGIASLLYGGSRMKAGYDKFHAGVGSRIQMRGRGMRDTDMNAGNRGAFSEVGMDEEAVRQSRLQAVDIFGKKGASQESVLQRAQFSRNFGVDVGSLQGLGSGMRAQVGTKGADRDMMKLQASLIASGITDAVGPYLETAASMLTDIRQQGLVNSSEVLSLMANFTKGGGSPERMGGKISSLQAGIQGSTGEANAFYQSAFARQGIGGRTVGGTQAAIRSGGLFGINTQDYSGLSGRDTSALNKLGIAGQGTGFKERAGAILGQFDKLFGPESKMSPQSRLAESRFAMNKGFGKNEVDSMETLTLLRKAVASRDPKQLEKIQARLQDKNATPEDRMLKNLTDIKNSTEGTVQAIETLRSIQLEYMGKQIAPAAMGMEKALLHIDEIISGIYDGISHFIPGMHTQADNLKRSESGSQKLSDSQINEVIQRGEGDYTQVRNRIMGNKINVEDRLKEAQQQREYHSKNGFGPAEIGNDEKNIAQLQGLLAMLNSNFTHLIDVHKQSLGIQKQTAEHTKKTSKSVAKAKQIPAKSGKTR